MGHTYLPLELLCYPQGVRIDLGINQKERCIDLARALLLVDTQAVVKV
jgi:hypothetical protein